MLTQWQSRTQNACMANWSGGVTGHRAAISRGCGFVLTKPVKCCLIWDVFTLGNMQQQLSTKVHTETLLGTLADFTSATSLLRSTEL
ncbi:hypothetical protein MC885_004013 [Smutsia gigantea]|nr:hypothetical protein MC885_004013 [Smutsia gigantea]